MRDISAERKMLDAKVAGKTIPLTLFESAQEAPEVKVLNWKAGDSWEGLTYPELRERIAEVTNGFLSLGLEPGGFVAILARNIPEHYLADYGVVHARGVGVSLYNTLAPEQIAYILGHCEASFVVVENREFLEKLLKIKDDIPSVRRVIIIGGEEEFSGDEWVIGWNALLNQGRKFGQAQPNAFEQSWKAVQPEDLLTLIYTSGTTGPPKGVMINHRNVLFVAHSLDAVGERLPGDKLVSYLPLAHIAERTATLYLAPILKGSVYCCPDLLQLGPVLAEVKPQIFFGVPRVFEKMYAALQAGLAQADEGQKQMADWAIDIGRQVVVYEQRGESLPEELASMHANAQMVLGAIRARLGFDEVRYVISGAAPIATEILEFFHAIGVRIAEIYGQSEDTGPTSLNPDHKIKIGTVGPALPGVEVKLAEDGELLVRGPNVSSGYYKDPELTAETFDSDGWLHSGDICAVDEDGYLKVVDRKKEIIITAGGKNIAPSNLENALKKHPLIGQVAVIGDRRPFVSALIVLDPDVAPTWASNQGIDAKDLATLSEEPTIVEEVQRWVDEVNKGFSNVEKIKQFTVLPTEWTAESEELTPTLKLKRRVINERHADAIERMYG